MLTSHSEAPSERLSVTFQRLAQNFQERKVTVAEVLAAFGANANAILVIFVCLPFCAPVSVPGTSTPAGLIAAVLAGQFALGRTPKLPPRLLRTDLPPTFFRFAFRLASTFLRWLEKGMHPRWPSVLRPRWALRLHCAQVVVAGLFLALPLPPFPPLTNTFPALAIVVTTAGLLERDGRTVLLGWLILMVGIAYLFTMAFLGAEVVQHFWSSWFGEAA